MQKINKTIEIITESIIMPTRTATEDDWLEVIVEGVITDVLALLEVIITDLVVSIG